MNKDELKRIADVAKEAVEHLEEPYRSIAYKEFLGSMLSSEVTEQTPDMKRSKATTERREVGTGLSEILDEKKPQSHNDTVIVLACHLFNSNVHPFSSSDILKCYEMVMIPEPANPTDAIIQNIKKGYLIKDVTRKGERQKYKVTKKGKDYVESLSAESQVAISSQKPRKGGKKSKKSSVPRSIEPIPFDIKGGDTSPPLREFYDTKNPGSHQEKLVVYVYYLVKSAGIEDVSEGHLSFAYQATKQKRPLSIYQRIIDTKNRTGHVSYDPNTKTVRLTSIGEDFVDHDLPKKEMKKP